MHPRLQFHIDELLPIPGSCLQTIDEIAGQRPVDTDEIAVIIPGWTHDARIDMIYVVCLNHETGGEHIDTVGRQVGGLRHRLQILAPGGSRILHKFEGRSY